MTMIKKALFEELIIHVDRKNWHDCSISSQAVRCRISRSRARNFVLSSAGELT
jgi:hypothetical protein